MEVNMENIGKAIDVLEFMEDKYDLSCSEINYIKEQYEDFKVYIPLIGRFSAGKSALINNLLGFDVEVCKEDIGVATAIPTEIFAGDEDQVCICRPEKEFLTMQEYMDQRNEITTETAEVVKLQLCCNVLSRFPSVALVDMPGLDSGYELHDKAIEYYLKKSMAYILVFPADELTVPKSMEPMLADLNSYNMPMCVVITKGNRIAITEEESKRNLRASLVKYFGDKEIPVFITETETGRVEELREYLEEMEFKASELGQNYYCKKLEPEFARVSNYLIGYLKNMELSLSELEEESDRLNSDIQKLNGTVESELLELEKQIPEIVEEIAMDVQAELSNHMDEYVFDLIHDTDITASINETVRSTLVLSYQTRVMKKLQKRLEHLSSELSLGSSNYASSLAIDIDKVCGKEISGVGRTAIDAIALIFGPIAAIAAHFVTGRMNKNIKEKRMAAENKVKQELSSNVFPSIKKEVKDKVEIDLKNASMEVRRNVEKDVAAQIEVLQKSLDEVIKKKNEEDVNRENKKIEIEEDIKKLQYIHSTAVQM